MILLNLLIKMLLGVKDVYHCFMISFSDRNKNEAVMTSKIRGLILNLEKVNVVWKGYLGCADNLNDLDFVRSDA